MAIGLFDCAWRGMHEQEKNRAENGGFNAAGLPGIAVCGY